MILCNLVLADYIIHNGQWHHTIPQYFNDDEKWRPHVIYEQIFCINIDIDAENLFIYNMGVLIFFFLKMIIPEQFWQTILSCCWECSSSPARI